MTIEDNKKYKLTGEQIKDLASRFGVLSGEIGDLANLTTTDKSNLVAAINEAAGGGGGGGIIELTAADYNYPTDNPTSVALWLLENGVYYIKDASVSARVSTGTVADRGTYIVADYSASVRQITAFNSAGVIYGTYKVTNVGAQENFDSFKSPAVVQTAGASTTSVMSQNAVTSMVFADPATMEKIKIGAGTSSSEGNNAIEIGHNASAIGTNGVACGYGASADAPNGVAIGNSALANSTNGGTAIGGNAHVTGINGVAISGGWQAAYAEATGAINIGGGGSSRSVTGQGAISLGIFAPANSVQGKIEVGSTNTSYGYNSSNYRLLTGLYDPQSAHDAATKGYVDPTTDSSAPTTATVGRLGQIQIDTTTATAYMCVSVDTVTPAYTWKQITA